MVPIIRYFFYFSFYSSVVYDTSPYFLCIFESAIDLVSNKKYLVVVSCVWTKLLAFRPCQVIGTIPVLRSIYSCSSQNQPFPQGSGKFGSVLYQSAEEVYKAAVLCSKILFSLDHSRYSSRHEKD